MTKPSTLLFLFAIAAPALIAQPIIGTPNMPQLGDVVTIGLCDDIVDANALNAAIGPMQIWDMSGLTEASEEQFTFVDPATSLWANDFPASNLCGISWEGSHSYYIIGASALETEGQATIMPGPAPEDTAKIIYPVDHERILELPYTYGDGHTDTFSGTLDAGPFLGTIAGTVDLDVDGYGTLILPTGTYTNVVRYHLDRVQNNTVMGITSTQTKEQWAWVSADHRFWLLLMEINDDGFSTSDLVWYDKNPALAGPSGQAEIAQAAWSLHPNPVEPGTSVSIMGNSDSSALRMEVIDATGRSLRTFPVGTTRFSTDAMAPGMYVVRFLHSNGTPAGTARLMVR